MNRLAYLNLPDTIELCKYIHLTNRLDDKYEDALLKLLFACVNELNEINRGKPKAKKKSRQRAIKKLSR